MSLIHNERTKLTATWFNSIAVAAIAVGGIAPSVAAFNGSIGFIPAIVLGLFWLSAGVGLHLAARAVLGRLRE